MSEGNEGFIPPPKSFETKCMHHCQEPSNWRSRSVIPHIVLSTIFQIENARNVKGKYLYGRVANPSRTILERVVAAVNKAKYGLVYSSGVSALTGVFGILKTGQHIIAHEELCSEKYRMFNNVASSFGIQTTFVDFSSTENITGAIRDNTKLLWVENPTYPTLKVFDICNLVTYAKQRRLYLGVDNTYLTPYLQRPLELNADIVLQSCTKYMNGHSDMSQGAVCTNRKDLMQGMQKVQRLYGLIPSPFDCYEVLRGLKTLALRMEEHSKNGLLIANFLQKHPAVEKVLHPALKTHENHEKFRKQSSGHSGIVSFYIKGGKEEAKRFMESLNLFTVTDIFGGNESTVQIPTLMSHEGLPKVTRERLKITDNLVNISVGLEDVCDILSDLEQALDKVKPKEEEKEKC